MSSTVLTAVVSAAGAALLAAAGTAAFGALVVAAATAFALAFRATCAALGDEARTRAIGRRLAARVRLDGERSSDEALREAIVRGVGAVAHRWSRRCGSSDASFGSSCSQLADRIATEFLQVAGNVDATKFARDALGALVRHAREYRRAARKADRLGGANAADRYECANPVFVRRSRGSTLAHLSKLVEAVLTRSLPWELRDAPHALVAAATLTKRLDALIANRLANPAWTRSKILQSFIATNEPKLGHETATTPVEPELFVVEADSNPVINPADCACTIEVCVGADTNPTLSTPTTMTCSQLTRDGDSIEPERFPAVEIVPDSLRATSHPIDIISQNSSEQNFSSRDYPMESRHPKEVKIYDRLIEGSIKTWNDDVDLECVSLGHDLLSTLEAPLRFESRVGRLWETDAPDNVETSSPNTPPTNRGASGKPCHGLWFGEEDNVDIIDLISENSPNNGKNNKISDVQLHLTKSFEHLSKTSMNNAMNKIVDLQDEAAGVMEGILDFGITKLKKGLQLSKLHETESDRQSEDSLDVKHSDSVFENDSPEYEYEESEDLSSTIAKLRFLLQQKTCDIESSADEHVVVNNEDKLCVNYDSTKNVNVNDKIITKNMDYESEKHHELSNDYARKKISTHISVILNETEEQCQRNITHEIEQLVPQNQSTQRFDKLFTRTVTGVLNTIKTAVGGESVDAISNYPYIDSEYIEKPTFLKSQLHTKNWIFIQNNMDFGVLIIKLLEERRGYCIVDAAQDSLDMINVPHDYTNVNLHGSAADSFQLDELDETELDKYPLWRMFSELSVIIMGDIMEKDIVFKFCDALVGEIMENILQNMLQKCIKALKVEIIQNFLELLEENNDLSITAEPIDQIDDDTINAIVLKKLPSIIVTFFGEENIKRSLHNLLSSINHQVINYDIIFNIFDIFVLHFTKISVIHHNNLISTPPPSA